MCPSSFSTQRLRKHADYGLVYAGSRKYSSTSLSYFYRERAQELSPTPRLGITVPRALGNAVVRNRIKRRLRIAAREALASLPAHLDLVLHPRPTVATMPHAVLLGELGEVFSRVTQRVASGADNTPAPRRPRGGKGSRR